MSSEEVEEVEEVVSSEEVERQWSSLMWSWNRIPDFVYGCAPRKCQMMIDRQYQDLENFTEAHPEYTDKLPDKDAMTRSLTHPVGDSHEFSATVANMVRRSDGDCQIQ